VENMTIHSNQVNFLLCPSDSLGWQIDTPTQWANYPGFRVTHGSYSGCTGTWSHWAESPSSTPSLAPLVAQDNGVFYVNRRTRIADVTDGTSNTFLLGERTLFDRYASITNWWFSGWTGASLFDTLTGMNPQRLVAILSLAAPNPNDWPGVGDNALMNSA